MFNCFDLLSKTDFSSVDTIKSIHPLKIERRIDYYRNMFLKEKYASSKILHVKSLDIQITERCSLKCKDCSNLMQYYVKPENSELDTMLQSIDKFVNIVDEIYELRVLGGDPFMSKDLHKVLDKLKTYEKVKKIVIYTNAKIRLRFVREVQYLAQMPAYQMRSERQYEKSQTAGNLQMGK